MYYEKDFSWIEGAHGLPAFSRGHMMDISNIEEFRNKYNNTGIYTTAYRYKDKNQKGEIWADFLYADFDNSDINDNDPIIAFKAWEYIKQDVRFVITTLNVLYNIKANQIRLYFSGKKGISLLIPYQCMGIKPNENLNLIFKNVILEFQKYTPNKTIDTRIYDRIRLWRLPNSIHEDTGLYKIPITYAELITLSLNKIKALAINPRHIKTNTPIPSAKAIRRYKDFADSLILNPDIDKPKKPIKFTPPCIGNLLNGDIRQGRRNNSLAALANFMRQAGKSEEEAKEILIEWNKENCIPKIRSSEFNSSFRSGFRSPKTWGCRAFNELSTCEPKECKLYRKENKGREQNSARKRFNRRAR